MVTFEEMHEFDDLMNIVKNYSDCYVLGLIKTSAECAMRCYEEGWQAWIDSDYNRGDIVMKQAHHYDVLTVCLWRELNERKERA